MPTANEAITTDTVSNLMEKQLNTSMKTLAAKLDEEGTDWSPAFIPLGRENLSCWLLGATLFLLPSLPKTASVKQTTALWGKK